MRTRFWHRPALLILALAASVGVAVTPAQAVTVNNGSMDDTGGNYNSFNALVPAGWTAIAFSSPDIFDENTNFNGFTWNASSDGGTFVHALGSATPFISEGAYQDISGLEVGETYIVSFEQSISWTTTALQGDGGHFAVTFGGETIQSQTMTRPAPGIAFDWQQQSLTFTATAETQRLTFRGVLVPDVGGFRVELALDGVGIAEVVPVVPTIPWLAAPGLGLGLGLAGWLAIRRIARSPRIRK